MEVCRSVATDQKVAVLEKSPSANFLRVSCGNESMLEVVKCSVKVPKNRFANDSWVKSKQTMN